MLGIELGGFPDSIVLRQIVHGRQMLSAQMPPETTESMRRNMSADGWFNLVTWLVTFADALVLWSAIRGPGRLLSTRTLLGYMLMGLGGFRAAGSS